MNGVAENDWITLQNIDESLFPLKSCLVAKLTVEISLFSNILNQKCLKMWHFRMRDAYLASVNNVTCSSESLGCVMSFLFNICSGCIYFHDYFVAFAYVCSMHYNLWLLYVLPLENVPVRNSDVDYRLLEAAKAGDMDTVKVDELGFLLLSTFGTFPTFWSY